MDKRFRSLTLIIYLIAFTFVSTISAAAILINIPQPWVYIVAGVSIIIATIAIYCFNSSIMRAEKEYHGADYAAMIDSITGGIIVFDGNSRIYTVSDDAKGYLDLPDYAIGMHKSDAIHDEELQRCISLAEKGESSLTEYTAHGITLRVLVDPVIFSNQIVGTMLLLLDMGEHLTLQKLKREFTANVSHELKTPLTSISGYAEMIATGIADQKDVPEFASRIQKESKRLLALISDIIRLSSLDEGSSMGEKEDVDIAELADECRDVLLKSAEDHNVTLTLSTEELIVNGSRSLLSELVYNLMDNAIRYNKDGGSVEVSVKGRTLTVTDTGIGIPKEHIPHIFERFYRVDKSRSKQTGGTGLGLAIVKHIAERHGATVGIVSEEGKGTSISVEFPQPVS